MLIKLKQFCSNCKQYTYKPNVQKKEKKKKQTNQKIVRFFFADESK